MSTANPPGPSESNGSSPWSSENKARAQPDKDPQIVELIALARRAEDRLNDKKMSDDDIAKEVLLLDSELDRLGLRSAAMLVSGKLRTSAYTIEEEIDPKDTLGDVLPDPEADMIGEFYHGQRIQLALLGFETESVEVESIEPGMAGGEYWRLVLGVIPHEDYPEESPWFEMYIDDIENLEPVDGSKWHNRRELRRIMPQVLQQIDEVVATINSSFDKKTRREKLIMRALQTLVIDVDWATLDMGSLSRMDIIAMLEEYITDEIGFDTEEPYKIKVSGEMSARRLDGVVDTQEFEGSVLARIRQIVLSEAMIGSSSTLQPGIEIRLPLNDSNSGHILVQIPPESIERIRSSRMRVLPFSLDLIERTTLASALPGLDGHHEQLPAHASDHIADMSRSPEAVAGEYAAEGAETEKLLLDGYNALDSDYDRSVYSDKLLQKILEVAHDVSGRTFTTEAESLGAYMQLRAHANAFQSIQLYGDARDLYMISGAGVSYMDYGMHTSYDVTARRHTVTMSYPPIKKTDTRSRDAADENEPEDIKHGDFTREYAAHFADCDIERVPVDDSEPDGEYRIETRMRFRTKTKPSRVVELEANDDLYAALELVEWINLDLGSEVYIRSYMLDKQRKRSELQAELDSNGASFGPPALVERIRKILSEFEREDPTEGISLRDIKSLNTIDEILVDYPDFRYSVADALKTAIGTGSHIIVVGDVFDQKDGIEAYMGNDLDDEDMNEVRIQLADVVVASDYTEGLTLVGSIVEEDVLDATTSDIVYVPISTITALNF